MQTTITTKSYCYKEQENNKNNKNKNELLFVFQTLYSSHILDFSL